jgi:3',5'-cyclic-AMP phosphodiesterase
MGAQSCLHNMRVDSLLKVSKSTLLSMHLIKKHFVIYISPMKTLWLTDIHLEFLEAEGLDRFYGRIEKAAADALLISGDIGQAPNTVEFIRQLQVAANCPVYFVFGNHDYYYGSIKSVRSQAMRAFTTGPVQWLNVAGIVCLTETTCCIGHDGWGDGRNGDYAGSGVRLNDFELISELSGLPRAMLLEKLMQLGDEAAAHMRQVLPEALSAYKHIVVLTHVPPFPESARWMGKPSAADWLPFFSCKAMGDVLLHFMRPHPEKFMTVLCGHTHGSGTANVLPNLTVHSGSARYGYPKIQKVFEWE